MTPVLGVLRFLAGGVISIIMAIVELLFLPVDGGKGKVFHAISRLWARAVLTVCGVNVRVVGLNRIDRSSNYVFVSNHASMFDIPCVIVGIPGQIRLVYKKELEAIPFFGWGLKFGSYIAIHRGNSPSAMRSLEEAVRKIRTGASVLLYAEGTRTLDGNLQRFKRGAFNLAVRAGIPVVPLTINGSFSILRKRSIVIRPGTVELVIESPIPVNGMSGKEAELRLMDQVHKAIARNYVGQE